MKRNRRTLLLSLLLASTVGGVEAQARDGDVFERLRAKVEAARGLRFSRKVPVTTLTPEQMRALTASQREREEPAPAEGPDGTEEAWKALGLLPGRTGLAAAEEAEEAYTLGFYLTEDQGQLQRGSLVVVKKSNEDATEVSAHELLHALHDQAFDLERMRARVRLSPSGAPAFDAELADSGLEEGVATLLGGEIARQLGVAPEPDRPSPFSIPEWIGAKSDFPYSSGAAFAQAVRAKGGTSLLDAVYRDPPTSSEQILHPERYLRANRDLPSEVSLADFSRALPGSWDSLDLNELGELGVGWLLGPEAGAGWDGDQYEVIRDARGQRIANWLSTWDGPEDAAEFRFALLKSRKARRGVAPGYLLVARQEGTRVFVTSGVRDEQVLALLGVARQSSVRKAPLDDDSWPARAPARGQVGELIVHTLGGTTLVRPGKTHREDALLATFALSPAGARLAEATLSGLSRLAERKQGVRRLGQGSFALRGGRTLTYAGTVLTLTQGSPARVQALRSLLREVEGEGAAPALRRSVR